MYLLVALSLCFACRLSLVAKSRGYFSLQCMGFALQWLLLLWSTGSRCTNFSNCSMQTLGHVSSVVVAHGLSCSMACGIFTDLYWQADSYPLYLQKSLNCILILNSCIISKRHYDSCT